jgi:hypothetical protein
MTASPQLDNLTSRDVRSIKRVAFALDKFEPYPSRIIPKRELDRLVEAGAVEVGPSQRPSVGRVGYRLTVEGWSVVVANWP